MNPIELVGELAAALRDVIQETPEESLGRDPKRVYMEMACRLVVRLAPKAALVPSAHVTTAPSTVDGYQQMRAVSDVLVHTLARYRAGGHEPVILLFALIDAYVRVSRAEEPQAKTSDLLRRLSDEALDAADETEKSTTRGDAH